MTYQQRPTEPSYPAATLLFSRIGPWTADLASAALTFDLPAVSTLCSDVDAERNRGNFRVAVVGEFNRGKSTLINQLLGDPVMPTGPLALTQGLVAVRGSPSARIDIEREDGNRSKLPLSPDSWSAVSPGDRVTVWADSDWLRDSGIELFDTAGANTTATDHLSAARRAIGRSDAVVLCVSAEQPLTETEREFLAKEVLRRQVPHVVVALTMTDRLEPEARDEVIEKVRADVADLGGPSLVISPGTNTSADQLRRLLTELTARPGWAMARARALAMALLDAAELCAAAAEAGQALRREDAAEQTRVIDRLRQDPPGTDSQWDALLAEFDVHGRELLDSLLDGLSQQCDDLVNRYLAELRTTHDPLKWWDEVLDIRALDDVKRQAAQCAGHLRAGVERGLTWLEAQATARFEFRATARRVPVTSPSAEFTRPRVTPTDTKSRRRMARVGGSIGALLAGAVAAVTGATGTVVFSAGGGLVGNLAGERIVRRLNEQNVSEARPLLTAALSSSFEQLARNLSALVPVLYRDLGDSFRAVARAAQDSRVRAAEAEMAAQARSRPDWDQLADTADRVATEIQDALQEP
jgi:GTP-binding protein EngB required for normal cell division